MFFFKILEINCSKWRTCSKSVFCRNLPCPWQRLNSINKMFTYGRSTCLYQSNLIASANIVLRKTQRSAHAIQAIQKGSWRHTKIRKLLNSCWRNVKLGRKNIKKTFKSWYSSQICTCPWRIAKHLLIEGSFYSFLKSVNELRSFGRIKNHLKSCRLDWAKDWFSG